MNDAAAAELHGSIRHTTDHIAIAPQQGGANQGGQPVDGGLIGIGPSALHVQLLLGQSAQLIEAPGETPLSKAGRPTDPPQKPVHRRMHPGFGAGAVVQALIAAHAPAQQIAEKKLLGKAHRLSLPLPTYWRI
jgi:hypothetical protein